MKEKGQNYINIIIKIKEIDTENIEVYYTLYKYGIRQSGTKSLKFLFPYDCRDNKRSKVKWGAEHRS